MDGPYALEPNPPISISKENSINGCPIYTHTDSERETQMLHNREAETMPACIHTIKTSSNLGEVGGL